MAAVAVATCALVVSTGAWHLGAPSATVSQIVIADTAAGRPVAADSPSPVPPPAAEPSTTDAQPPSTSSDSSSYPVPAAPAVLLGERGLEAQLAWVSENAWTKNYSWGHSYIPNEDCANFASRSLLIRGLPENVLHISSTKLRNWLTGHGYVETPDSPAARGAVKVGDIIQFDWQPSASNPSDRDHTGIVTKIETGVDGTITVRYTAHTDPDNDPKVDQSIEASLADYGHDINGLVYFISIP